MKAIEEIRNHPLYKEFYEKLEKEEEGRVFCRHQMQHFLDVARIAYIDKLEKGLPIRKEVIYAAALLHDIGKSLQYSEKIPHEKASAEIAEKILRDLPEGRFTEVEIADIISAIWGHRDYQKKAQGLDLLLYLADKKSRACYACEVEKECNWSAEKKNSGIEI